MTPKVSIIVPVYNTEDYISRCIDSLLLQTYSNLEILLIDDGSTDNSKEICETYAKIDSRIRFFSQENHGVSAARNKGLDKMTGDFLCFLDSDDWFDSESIEMLVKQLCETDADVVFFNIMNEKGTSSTPRLEPLDTGVVNKYELIRQMICYVNNKGSFTGYYFSSCSKMYRVEALRSAKNGLCHFDESIRILEDGIWLMSHIPYFKKGVLDDRTWYHRTLRSTSAMGDTSKWIDTAQQYLCSYSRILDILVEIGNDDLIALAKESCFGSTRNYINRLFKEHCEDNLTSLYCSLKEPYRYEFLSVELTEFNRIKTSHSFKLGRKINNMRQTSRLVNFTYKGVHKVYRGLKKLKAKL